jgi:hypothetical protein
MSGGFRIALPTFIRAIRPFAQHLTQDVDWLALFGERGEDLVSALAVAIRKPREWVAARELDEAIRLSEAVFEVNADFFIQRLAPVLARVETIGARFSNASSGTATATPKS